MADQLALEAPSDGRPTLYVTNWSSVKLHGAGRKFSIMVWTPGWAPSNGEVGILAPDEGDLCRARAGVLAPAEYRECYGRQVHRVRHRLRPGRLQRNELRCIVDPEEARLVRDGDTLCCICSKEQAARGECHRVWAAEALARAGWRVILDGVELEVDHA